MRGLITDRQQSNVDRLKELSSKGWSGMTDDEKAEWLGDPKATVGANLFSRTAPDGANVAISHRLDHIIATTNTAGRFRYASIVLGPASDFEGKTLTLSVGSTSGTANTYARIGLYWHDWGGYYEFAGLQLNGAGSTTVALTENTGNRMFLSAYVYVSTGTDAEVGATVRYNEVMLTIGDTKYPFAPYTEVVATPATKGAYNYSDLNRVEMAVAELSDMFGLGLTTKTDWDYLNIPAEDDMDRFLSNLRAIQRFYPNPSSSPPLPVSMNKMTYETANNIEKILVGVYESAAKSYRSGEVHSGEV